MKEPSLESDVSTISERGRMNKADTIELKIPARLEYVRLTRLVISGIATQADFSLDEIEDVRIAVDELCATLIDQSAEGADLIVTFTLAGATLRCRAAVETHAPLVELDELSQHMLAETVDDYQLTRHGELAVATMEKTRAATSA